MPSRHEEVSLGEGLYGQVVLSGQGTSNFRGALKLNYTTNTNKSSQLVFAAAIVAASLQLFTLPGLTIESQQNLAQRGGSNSAEIMCEQDLLCGLVQEAQKANKSKNQILIIELLGAASSFAGAIGILTIACKIKELEKDLASVSKKFQEFAKNDDEIKIHWASP